MNITIKYSPSTNGFYPSDLSYTNLPDDLVEISLDEHTALMDLQSVGHCISAGADGIPIATLPPQPTEEQIRNTQCVTKLQFCLNLSKYRLLDNAFTYIDTLPRSNVFRLIWECNGSVSYSDSNVQELLHSVLKLDTILADDMFIN